MSRFTPERFKSQAKDALRDDVLRGALRRATDLFGERRQQAIADVPDWEALRETGRAVLGVIAAGIFLGTWRASGLYFDVARLDSLFTFLLLASLYRFRWARGRPDLVLAAVLAFLAVMTKQTGAVVVAPVAVWCLWADWKAPARDPARLSGLSRSGGQWDRVIAYGLVLAALVGSATWLLNGILDEHFLLHIVGAQQQHGILQ